LRKNGGVLIIDILPYPLSASVDLLNILLKYASYLGIDEHTILSESKVDLSSYRLNDERIPIDEFNTIWSFIVHRSHDHDFGLHFGEQSHALLSGHLLYALMMKCENAEQAIRKNFLYHKLVTDIIRPNMKVESALVYLTWEMGHPSLAPDRHLSESVLALFVSMLRFLTGDQFKLTKVQFVHPSPENTAEHERIFQAPLVFGQKRNEIVFSKSYLNSSILLANQKTMADLEQLVQKALHRAYTQNSWNQKVAQILFNALLEEKRTDIETIAGHLAMTARTLQLKLKEEGTSFRKLQDEVRKELAIGYLKDGNDSICEIALLLGFSDQSAFHHAFKRWTGKTPGEYRRRPLIV
jgi:AraC-like DNA-binding protein